MLCNVNAFDHTFILFVFVFKVTYKPCGLGTCIMLYYVIFDNQYVQCDYNGWIGICYDCFMDSKVVGRFILCMIISWNDSGHNKHTLFESQLHVDRYNNSQTITKTGILYATYDEWCQSWSCVNSHPPPISMSALWSVNVRSWPFIISICHVR